jgi:uncharacterized phage-associated protein
MPARYRVNTRKAVEVILWLAEKQAPIDFYHVLKVVFYADKYHLNAYGRPIVGDTYGAFNHGPVATTVYDILKQDALEVQAFDAYTEGSNDNLPFEVRDRYWVHPKREANKLLLSKSDMEALDWAFGEYGSLPFKKLERLTHDEPSWKNAYNSGNFMLYEDLVDDGPSKANRIEDLEETASNIAF